jgi:cysteine desulfuration protein SufE
MKSVENIQQEIIEEFKLLIDDRESTIFYIMELGQKLPQMDESLKTEENIIKGCQSKVWLSTSFSKGKVIYIADSNTDITKGLISLLIRILSGQTPDTILNTELNFVEKIGMGQVIGSQRSNGFNAMIKQMKLYALGYRAKAQVNE